jgi:hypothetical protein
MQEFSKAEESIQQAATLFANIGRKKAIIDGYKAYIEVLENVGQKEQAEQYKKKLKDLTRK